LEKYIIFSRAGREIIISYKMSPFLLSEQRGTPYSADHMPLYEYLKQLTFVKMDKSGQNEAIKYWKFMIPLIQGFILKVFSQSKDNFPFIFSSLLS